MDVILRSVGGIAGSPLHHRERAPLERDEIEESASVLECNAMLHRDHRCGASAVLEDALFDLHGTIGRADQEAGCVRNGIARALHDGTQVTLVVFER